MKTHTVIPAVRGFKELEKALHAPSDVIFLLEGEIIQLRSLVEGVKRAGKKIYLHLDLIKGIKEDEASIHYLAKDIRVDGILSTRTSSLLHAKKYGLVTVQRGFLIDSHSMKTILHAAQKGKPDYLELLPSYSYEKVKDIQAQTEAQIIMGGFIDTRQDIARLFQAGVGAVSTSRSELWNCQHDPS
jgi:glycerol uptake operon antiterminator